MTEKTYYVMRRILETIGVMLISSGVIYWLIVAELIPETRESYVAVFSISAALFLVLSYINLCNHFWALKFNIKKYLIVNLFIFLLLAAIGFVALKYGSNAVYTAFFGYTKPFRQMFNASNLLSAIIFWALYLLDIFAVLIITLFFDKEYRKIMQRSSKKN